MRKEGLKKKICKICKVKFVPLRSLQVVCSPKCGIEYTKRQKAKEWTKEKAKRKKQLLTVQDWLKIAQQTFNAYIRERDKGKPCISCGNDKPKKVNAGHFFSSGGHKAVTFDEENVHLQCEYCNTYLSGNLINYRKGLIERIGEDRLEQLEQRANATAKYTVHELEELTKEYKQKIKQLKNKEQ